MIVSNIPFILILLIPGTAALLYGERNDQISVAAGIILVVTCISIYWMVPASPDFFVDHVSWVFLLMISAVYLLSASYSLKYMGERPSGISRKTFFLLLNLFTVSMLFSIEVNNYGLMWVGIEATTIASALLIMSERSAESLEATWRYIIIVSAGVAFAFISVILIYYQFGTLSVTQILSMNRAPGLVTRIIVSVALIGFGTKIGIFPVHTWLPDAHSEAPAPVSAMFSGVLLPSALYVLYRIYEIDPFRELFIWFAVVSIIFSSIMLSNQRMFKRMFAYSTMENMNIALIGFAILTPASIAGALILLLSHSLSKAGAFYSSGNIMKTFDTKEVGDVHGLMTTDPGTGASLLLSSLGVTGAPPFGTFFGEILIFYSMLEYHLTVEFSLVLVFVALSFIAINYNVSRMLSGDSVRSSCSSSLRYIALISSAIPIALGIAFLGVIGSVIT